MSVLIPASWTPEQALAVLELLNDLRDALCAIHGDRIQDMLQQEQGFLAADLLPGEPDGDEPLF
ncbi:MAG TPA: hypothetical protein VMU81_23560 [Acetobacteraceae bacterium]|nr:hypothetical protein [Acetobacteraceae bacterium]